MKEEKFNFIVNNRLTKCKEILIEKAKEYSSTDNRLHNFDKASQMTGEHREKVLWGMAMKHLVSIVDIINSMQDLKHIPKQELVSEKIGDMVNYLLLLEASIEDRRDKQELPF
jgi:hypothetical protein